MFSLTTIPVHCCSTVFTDVTSLALLPTLVTLLAKRTYIAEYYCWYVSLQCYETHRGVVQSSTFRSATTKCTGKVIRKTIWNYQQYYCLLNTTTAVAILSEATWFCRFRCWSKLCVWNCSRWSALSSGLLVWRRVVRQARHKIPTDRNWKMTR